MSAHAQRVVFCGSQAKTALLMCERRLCQWVMELTGVGAITPSRSRFSAVLYLAIYFNEFSMGPYDSILQDCLAVLDKGINDRELSYCTSRHLICQILLAFKIISPKNVTIHPIKFYISKTSAETFSNSNFLIVIYGSYEIVINFDTLCIL